MSTTKREDSNSDKGAAPSVTEGGVMPSSPENSENANAYPRPDATKDGTLPRAIADTVGDPTGDKSRGQLSALAQDRGIPGFATMTRAELASALNATMTTAELAEALRR
jgi:hypothetical protein